MTRCVEGSIYRMGQPIWGGFRSPNPGLGAAPNKRVFEEGHYAPVPPRIVCPIPQEPKVNSAPPWMPKASGDEGHRAYSGYWWNSGDAAVTVPQGVRRLPSRQGRLRGMHGVGSTCRCTGPPMSDKLIDHVQGWERVVCGAADRRCLARQLNQCKHRRNNRWQCMQHSQLRGKGGRVAWTGLRHTRGESIRWRILLYGCNHTLSPSLYPLPLPISNCSPRCCSTLCQHLAPRSHGPSP
mmetsp:Transcript_91246/g.158202  ORF Transcript_91246/g.158202 Transcript_91246/m.158202 type:complete len:238 (+) Transcript_91246:216-929(+)